MVSQAKFRLSHRASSLAGNSCAGRRSRPSRAPATTLRPCCQRVESRDDGLRARHWASWEPEGTEPDRVHLRLALAVPQQGPGPGQVLGFAVSWGRGAEPITDSHQQRAR